MLKRFRIVSTLTQQLRRRYCVCHSVDPCDPGTRITLLPNGVRIATERTASPLLCISLFIEAGPRFETACNNGITHFIEHMAFRGFKSMNRCQLEDTVLYMGGNITAKTSREIQVFSAKCPPEYAANVVDIFYKIITDIDFSGCAIEMEKYNMQLEMIDTDNDPKAVLFDYLHQTAFQGTALGQRVIGPTKNIQKFDTDFVSAFVSEHYQPYKLCLATSGNINHEDMVGFAVSWFGKMVGNPSCESDEGPCRFSGSQVMYRDDSMPFAHVAIAFEAPGYTSQDYLTLLVASCMVGQWDKSQGGGLRNGSPVARAAACAGLCESYESFYITYRDVGLWGIYFVADKMALEDMLYNIQNQWMHLCVTSQYTDIERGMNLAKLKLAKRVTGSVNSCYDIGKQLLYTCTRKSLVDQYDGLSKIKMHSIRDACDKVLYDRCPAVASVGPSENLPEYTRIRAGQYWLRI